MKRKYITTLVLLACYSKPPVICKNIYAQLEETIGEREKIMRKWEQLLTEKPVAVKKDIHARLKETIAEHKMKMRKLERFFLSEKNAA